MKTIINHRNRPGSRTPDDISIKPRKMRFDLTKAYDELSYHDDPMKKHFFNAFSAALPLGEDFFLYVLRGYKDEISDPKLKQEARHFCGQEAHHSHEHRRWNNLLKKNGYPWVGALEKFQAVSSALVFSGLSHKTRLSMVAGAEHFTTIFARMVLSDPDYWFKNENEWSSLTYWHAVEELEHKSVCFDVYQHISGSYSQRMLGFALVNMSFVFYVSIWKMYFLYEDKLLTKPKTWKSLVRFYFGAAASGSQNRRPEKGLIFKLYSDFVEYLDPEFHPWNRNDRQLFEPWVKKHKEGGEVLRLDFERITSSIKYPLSEGIS